VDPILAAFAEFWWIGPAVIGAGTLGWMGLRGQRGAKARRIAYDASLAELKAARSDATASRIAVRVARAELGRAQAERAAGRATSADVAAARKALDAAQRETRAAAATIRVRRANLTADRAALSRVGTGRGTDPAQLPLGRLIAADDAISARWMEYETDPARAIAFPAMSDARVPATAAFLAELRTVRALRPASADARITPAQFAAYRDGVARLARAFDVAEAEAWRLARAAGSAPAGPGPDTAGQSVWVTTAQEFAATITQTVIARGAEALARATAARAEPRADDHTDAHTDDRPGPHGTGSTAPTGGTAPTGTARATPPSSAAEPSASDPRSASATPPQASASPPQWPIPSRSTRPSRP